MSERGFGCPDLDQVAVWLDGRLAAEDDALLQAHVADCAACLDLVAEVMLVSAPALVTPAVPRHKATMSPVRHAWSRGGSVAGWTAAAALFAAALLVPESWVPRQTREPKLADLAVAAGLGRPVEGRLTGGFTHRPWSAPLAGGQGGALTTSTAIELVAGKIREDIDVRGTPPRLHAYGVSQALLGDWGQAALALAAAAREQPKNARYQSDVAAVYLERARRGQRPDDLIKALAAAERACLADPALPEAWFNLALALEGLSLRSQARGAWADYLRRDASSAWAREARARLAALDAPPASARWPGVESRLRQHVDADLADEATRVQTTEARLFLETVQWPSWAAAVTSGGTGADEREALRIMSDALLRLTGDALYRDAVVAVDRAEVRGVGAVRALASAHQAYATAAALVRADRFSDALPGLMAARDALTASASPFAHRAQLDVAAAAHYLGQLDVVGQALATIDVPAAEHAYRFVTSRIGWIRGLVAFGQGRYGDVRQHWEEMLALSVSMQDVEQEAAAHGLLANLHDHLGDSLAAWDHRAASLEGLAATDSERIRYGLLISAAGQALKEEDPAAALALQEEVVQTARRSGRSAAIAESHARRAAIHAALARPDLARADIEAARAEVISVPDSTLRARLETIVLAAEVDTLHANGTPGAAAAAASRAIRAVEDRGESARLPPLYLVLSQSLLRLGQVAAARQAAERGIVIFERDQRQRPGTVANTFDRGWKLYEVALMAALSGGDADAAFRYGGIARSRAIPDRDGIDDPGARELQQRIAEGEGVIALNQLDDELVVWVVTRSGVRHVVRPLSERDASRLVLRQADEITWRAQEPAASAALFGEIVRPVAAALTGVTRVTVAPDAPYFAAAFPGLWDAERRRYWVEDVELAVTTRLDSIGEGGEAPLASAVVDVGEAATPDAVFAVWSRAPANAVVLVPALAASNNLTPQLSRLVFADRPGRPYSGTLLPRDVVALPRVRGVLLANIDPGSRATSGAGSYDIANAFLAAGASSVVSAIAPVSAGAECTDRLRRRLEGSTSVVSAVAGFQRDVLQSTGHRLGAWSRVVVYGASR